MANLNLSEFTEKLFVADADHTFIWDTAASISKRVSRNSWLNSGTLTFDAPVTISQTWGTTGTYTAAKVNVTETATANPASLLLDLQLGGVSKFKVDKNGNLISTGTSITTAANGTWGTPSAIEVISGGHIRWASRGRLYSQTTDSISILDSTATLAATLAVEATNTLALRNGAAAQTFNVYGTYTSGTSYERLTLSAPSAANAIIGTNKGSGGGTARGLELQTDGVTRMTISTGGDVTLSNALVFGGIGQFRFLSSGVAFLTNAAQTDFGRLCLGGNTASAPAIKRSTVRIQAVLANDSGFTNIQGKLTTDTDYTATVVTPTGFLTLYDAQGTAYRVPCVLAP